MAATFLCAGFRAVGISSNKALVQFAFGAATLLLSVFVLQAVASAEIILDDFDDAVDIAPLPMGGDSSNVWAITNNVGPLQAMRQIKIASLGGRANGQFDANISSRSLLTADIPQLHPQFSNSEPIVSVEFEYYFNSADFSQGNANDTIFLDFKQMSSAIPPSLLLVLVDGLAHLDGSVPRSYEPFSIAIPFSSFTKRDGSAGAPDYAHIHSLEFEIRVSAYTGGGPDPLNFFMQLDRIRIGSSPAVPEQSALATTMVALASVVAGSRWRSTLHPKGGWCDDPTIRLLPVGLRGNY